MIVVWEQGFLWVARAKIFVEGSTFANELQKLLPYASSCHWMNLMKNYSLQEKPEI